MILYAVNMQKDAESVGRLDEATGGAEPLASRHEAPVGLREEILLQVVERPRWRVLIFVECSACLSSVFEFGENEFFVAHKDRAGCIAVVDCRLVRRAHLLQDVVHKDRGLRVDGSSGLGGWQIAHVAMTKDV